MKVRELATVAVFLLGLSQLPTLLAEFFRTGLWFAELRESEDLFTENHYYFVTQVGSLAVSLTKAVVIVSFVFLPNWWAGLVPKLTGTLEIPSLSLDSVRITLVALTGLVLVALALGDLAEYLVSWHTRRAFEDSAIDLTVSQVTHWPLVAESVIRLVLGAWMIFGAHGLVEAWRRLQGGTDNAA